MKIVIINGSARKGNTLTAINAFYKIDKIAAADMILFCYTSLIWWGMSSTIETYH